MLKSCLNAYPLSSLEYCAPVRMSSTESHLGLLDSIGRSAERLYDGELCCLRLKGNVSALCLFHMICHRVDHPIYHRVDHPMIEHLNHFVAARNTRASAALVS